MQRLRILPDDDILEIGTGSGYQTAILARLAGHVYTIERHPPLHRLALERFGRLKLDNITAIIGDGSRGWPERRLFDRILVTAGAERVPDALSAPLSDSGLMIMPIGPRSKQHLTLISRCGGFDEMQKLMPVRCVPPLPGETLA